MKRYLVQEKNLLSNRCRSVICIGNDLTDVMHRFSMNVDSCFEYLILGVENIVCEKCKNELTADEINKEHDVCAECFRRGY